MQVHEYSSFLGFIEEANENAGITALNLWWWLPRVESRRLVRSVRFREVAATKNLVR